MLVIGVSCVLANVSQDTLAAGFVLQVMIVVALSSRHLIQVRRQEIRLRQAFHAWAENLLLRMKMGVSFRTAFRACVEKCPDLQLKGLLRRQELEFQLEQAVANLRSTSACAAPFFREVFLRMAEIDRVPGRAQARVELLIRAWKQEEWFRRRSRQVRRQSQIQMLFLGIMYLFLLLWSAQRYPSVLFFPAARWSILFCLGGIATLMFLQRRRPWKI
ncbi:MAG: hypothetical protein K2X47_18450 [Bdellovibrionales bacterium]|nr:hypothetical protein [Bdellovibrionales bacterium]